MMNGLCAGMEHARTKRLTNQKRRETSSGHQQELPELRDALAGEDKCDLVMGTDYHFARQVLLCTKDPFWDTE